MKGIKIYMEGGGETEDYQAQLRAGLDQLLSAQKNSAQQKRIKWKLIPRGGRDQTYDAFINACRQADAKTLIVLLVDSEGPLAAEVPGQPEENAQQRKDHLIRRDKWNLRDVPASNIHLMIQCTEAWIVADPEALAGFYRKDFRSSALPARRNLEEEPKSDVYERLKNATRDCQKGEYGKIKHASKLLAIVSPAKVADRCQRFKTFSEWLTSQIEVA